MRAVAGLLVATLAVGCSTGKAVSLGTTPQKPRAPDAAAYLILTNGFGRGLRQWISVNYSSGLFDAYREWAVFEPARGQLFNDAPVYHNLLRHIERAAGRGESVDLFIFAHTNEYYWLMNDLPPAARSRIRLVYNAGCNNARQWQQWLRMGAHAYVGHPGESCSQMFVHYFQTPWWSGMTLHDAVAQANGEVERSMLDPGDLFGVACRGDESGAAVFAATAAQLAGDGSIRIDTPLR